MCSMKTLQDVAGKQGAAILMLAPGPVKLRGVGDAQARIVAMAKGLAAPGVIEISEGKNDEMVQ